MELTQLQQQLDTLIEAWENEVVEFKEANDNFKTDLIGKYYSALANEANLRGKEQARLVFGVRDATRSVVGTDYRTEPERLHSNSLAGGCPLREAADGLLARVRRMQPHGN